MTDILNISELSCGYGDTEVVHGVSFGVRAGEMLGIIGPNGSGKTTLLRTVSGVLRPFGGRVLVEGQDLHELSPGEIARRLAFVSQDVLVDFSFTVREIVMMGRTPHIGRLGWETGHDRETAERAMKFLDVLQLADRPITDMSGGERQRVFLAMALAQEPRVLLLDEPTSHLDINHQVAILDLIHRMKTGEGVSVLLVSHDLNLASEYCDRLVLFSEGSVKLMGSPEEVLTEANIREVYGTRVRLEKNPSTGRPHVMLMPRRPPD